MNKKVIILHVISLILILNSCQKPVTKDLITAVSNRDVKKVEELLGKGVSVKSDDSENDPLIIAVKNEDYKIIELLLSYGADPNLKIDNKDSLLLWAVKRKSLLLIELLIEKGADVNYISNRTPVFSYAIHLLPEQKLFQFIDNGLNYLSRNEKNQSFFEELLIAQKEEAALYILSYKTVSDDAVSDEYMSMKLIYYWTDGTKKIADTLIEKGLRLNVSLPLLQEAIRDLNYEAVEWLLNQGVSPTSKYIDPTSTDVLNEGDPLDVVNDTEYRLLHYAGKDYKHEENDPGVIEIRKIGKLLKERIEKNVDEALDY